MVLLDTHIWLWWLLGDSKLKSNQRLALDELASRGEIAISWATIWETEMLERKNRVKLEPDFETWISIATQPEICTVIPVDTTIIIHQRTLPENFHGHPGDRLIATTSLLTGYPLATVDDRIIKSGVIKIWEV